MKSETLNYLPLRVMLKSHQDFFKSCQKKDFYKIFQKKMKNNIESRAKNEGFGWLKYNFRRLLVLFLCCLLAGFGARGVLSGKLLAGTGFNCRCCSKVVRTLKLTNAARRNKRNIEIFSLLLIAN